ncbi:aminotransferase class IV [Streptomyces sp. M19]
MTIWLDGALREVDGARVSVLDHGLTVGDGVFETVKAVDGRPFALTRHLRRLAASAAGLGLPEPDLDEVREGCEAVLADNPMPLGRLRITYTGDCRRWVPSAAPPVRRSSSPSARRPAAPTPPPPPPCPGPVTNAGP